MNNTHKILITDIENSPKKVLTVDFEEFIEEISTKTPVKACVEFKDLGNFIEAKGEVSTTLLLECDRCLSEFEYFLEFDIDEMFAKESSMSAYTEELELKSKDFITDLDNSEEIDLYDLLYQSVILNIPNKKVCGINCKEGMFETDEDLKLEDPRMEVFKNIKIK